MPKISIERLKTLASAQNIAEHLDETDLMSIGEQIVELYEEDLGNMQDKIDRWKKIVELAGQVAKEKNFPWPKASNMKFPIIAESCIRFGARVYPEIVQSGRVARAKVYGEDPEGVKKDRAIRVETHLNYQITEEIDNWETETDVLLALLPVYGCYWKKIYFDQLENKPVVEIRDPTKIITSQKSYCVKDELRISDPITLSRNKIIERIRSGLFLNVDLPAGNEEAKETDRERGEEDFVEQHCFIDLDDDGYAEPYVATVHKASKTVMRITARFTEEDVETTKINGREVIKRIKPFVHFEKYIFMHHWDGSTLGLGFGELLTPLTHHINTTINQLTDAGTLQTTAANSGFIGRGIRMDSGPFRLTLGQWIPVETRGGSLRDNIHHLPSVEPSQTLFALLGLFIEAAQRLASSNQVAPGEIPTNTPATTILAVIEEGMKVYSSIYKRIFSSIKDELRKIYYLNKMFGDPEEYAKFQDSEDADMMRDYEISEKDIFPVASPEVASDMQRLMFAQSNIDLLDRPAAQAGGLDPRAVIRNYLEATRQSDIDNLQPPPPEVQPPSLDETMIQMQAEIQGARLELQERELRMKEVSEFVKSMKTLAEAEAVEPGEQMRQYTAALQAIAQLLDIEQQATQIEQAQPQPPGTGQQQMAPVQPIQGAA